MYVIVPPNCTDRLQPLDVSVNHAAKHFMWSKFESWYADRIMAQQQNGGSIQPVVLPIRAQWMVELYDYFKGHPNIIINHFKKCWNCRFISLLGISNLHAQYHACWTSCTYNIHLITLKVLLMEFCEFTMSGVCSGIQISVHFYMISITEYDCVINDKHEHG